MLVTTTVDLVDAGRFLQRYAKAHNAGGFATPSKKELAGLDVVEWPGRTVAVATTTGRTSVRTDWRGARYEVAAGLRVITHLARDPGARVPDLSAFDLVTTYRDDLELSAGLERQGRVAWATRISAAGEMLTTWAPPGARTPDLDPIDELTVGSIALPIHDTIWARAHGELGAVDGWYDDYPYYSDGSWSALSLRGFSDDPTWGVKPAEMSRKWNDAHPGALDEPCRWTSLHCPALVAITGQVLGAVGSPRTVPERVRLLRMGRGHLGRHTDITDKAGGPGFGQVIRWHVPLVTDPAVTMTTWGLDGRPRVEHLGLGRAWYLDARKPHAVDNPTGTERIHLTVDLIVDEAVAETLETMCASRT